MPDQEVDQARYRRSQQMRDQFGRRWAAVVEIATGDPVGPISPVGFTDPLQTPMKYLTVPRDSNGLVVPGRLRVDFEQWIKDLEDGDRDWMVDLHDKARQLYSVVTPDQARNLVNDPYVTKEVGDRPGKRFMHLARDGENVADIIKRAVALDPELLGMAADESYDPTAISWPEFAAQCRREGKTQKQASVLWAVRKATAAAPAA